MGAIPIKTTHLQCLSLSVRNLCSSILQQKKLPCPLQLVAAQIMDFHVAFGGSMDHRPQCGLIMAFSSNMDHGNLLKRLNPESEPFFLSNVLLLLRVWVIMGLGSILGRTCRGFQVAVHHPALGIGCPAGILGMATVLAAHHSTVALCSPPHCKASSSCDSMPQAQACGPSGGTSLVSGWHSHRGISSSASLSRMHHSILPSFPPIP